MSDTTLDNGDPAEPKGIDGWLLFFIIAQGIVVFIAWINLFNFPTDIDVLDSDLVKHYPPYWYLVVLDLIMTWVQSIVPIIGIYFIIKGSKHTVSFWKIYLGLLIVVWAVDLVGLLKLNSFFESSPRYQLNLKGSREMIRGMVMTVGGLCGSFLWLSYWQLSTRVKNTFPQCFSPSLTEESMTFVHCIPCPHCGEEQLASASHCMDCGKELLPEAPPGAVKRCPHCDAQLLGSSKFCLACGEILDGG